MGQRHNLGGLVDFHTRNKLLILSHSPEHYRSMGKLVARGKELPFQELLARYQNLLLDALRRKSTASKTGNVLMHMMGYFKEQLSADEKQELLEILAQFRKGTLPLIVPVTLMNHYVRKYDQPYLKEQVFLSPHPLELQLRNHG